MVPSYSVRVTRRASCSHVSSRPWRSRVFPLAKCDGFRALSLQAAALRVVRAANAVGRPCGSEEVDAAVDALAAVLRRNADITKERV